jgi:PAS domain S-box-containing protein
MCFFLVDVQVDGLAVINAQGIIMMVNNAALGMFGYPKGELEGKNVSVLMPQPWSSKHDSFLQVKRAQPAQLSVGRQAYCTRLHMAAAPKLPADSSQNC